MLESRKKLNLGSGKDYRHDAVNVDLRENVGADIIKDVRELEFPDDRFKEIFAHDIIDMVPYVDAKTLLKNCFGWLKPHGSIRIHLPNLGYLAELLTVNEDQEAHEALRWLYGSDGETGEREIREKYGDIKWKRWAYTIKSLTKLLEDVGFTIISKKSTCNGFGMLFIAVKR